MISLKEEYPIGLRSKFCRILRSAFKATNDFMESNTILEWEVGRELKPYIRRVAVEHQFKIMVENDKLGLTYRIKPNVKKNCSHIEIYNKNSILTINQVKYKYQISRDAKFRRNLAYGRQLTFLPEIEEETINTNKDYVQLTYGGDEFPDFIVLGIPHYSFKYWIDTTSLLEELSIIKENPQEEEGIKLQLKEFLKENIDKF